MKKKPEHIKQADWDSVESPSLSDELLLQMNPVSQHHPNIPKRVRGLQKLPTKIPVSIRLSPEVLKYFKAQGNGWQTNINSILSDYIKNHQVL